MSDDVCLIISLLYEEQLLKIGLKVPRSKIADNAEEYPMELENKKILYDLLPEHIQSYGTVIVAVEEIFDFVEIQTKPKNISLSLTCNECYWLHPTEKKQLPRIEKHSCAAGMGFLPHRGQHPNIPRPADCNLFKRRKT